MVGAEDAEQATRDEFVAARHTELSLRVACRLPPEALLERVRDLILLAGAAWVLRRR